jgi:hypothetical protein
MVDTQQASHTLLHPKTTYGLKQYNETSIFKNKYPQKKCMNMRTNHIPFHIPSLAELLEQYSLGSQQLRTPAY